MSKGRVYDPIHDVFQVQPSCEHNPPVLRQASLGSSGRGTVAVEQDNEHDDESTQSDDAQELVYYPVGEELKHNHHSGTFTKKKGKEPSKYTRHLKKQDGEHFTRKDIQFAFLYELLSNKRKLFDNVFQNSFSITLQKDDETSQMLNVTDSDYNARFFIGNDKLTFSQLYVLTIASSKKCSKILRDKLLFDHQVAFSTCVLSLLVNFGRLNTTINFFPEMTSQLRTFHSIPCLQHQTRDPKSLQDTPRIKSILKTIPLGQEPINLSSWYSSERAFHPNLVNLLFTICDNPQIVNVHFVLPYIQVETTLFQIFDSPKYQPKDRADFFLWLTYIHLETDLSKDEIAASLRLFNVEDKFSMRLSMKEYDIDTESELVFGKYQSQRRLRFLKKHPRKATSDSQQSGDQHVKDDNAAEVLQEPHHVLAEDTPTESVEEASKVVVNSTSKQNKNKPRIRVKAMHHEVSQNSPTKNNVESVHEEFHQEEDFSNWAQTVEDMIEADSNFKVTPDLTHSQVKALLLKAHEIARKKRQELGLIKAFDEYEDVALATVIGVRGKKRKKFSDGVLGYETDYINHMHTAKKIFLHRLDKPLSKEQLNF